RKRLQNLDCRREMIGALQGHQTCVYFDNAAVVWQQLRQSVIDEDTFGQLAFRWLRDAAETNTFPIRELQLDERGHRGVPVGEPRTALRQVHLFQEQGEGTLIRLQGGGLAWYVCVISINAHIHVVFRVLVFPALQRVPEI